VNLHENNCTLQALKRRMRKLLTSGTWLDCCLESYFYRRHSSSEEDSEQVTTPFFDQRRFRIFDTSLLALF